jgi:putative ABC transport system permease protein
MIQSFKKTVYTWVEQTISADLLVHQATPGGERSALTMPHRLRHELLSIEGVRDADSARGIDVEYAGDLVLLVAVDFAVYAQYGTFPFAAGDAQQGTQQVIEQQGVLVSENFSRRYDIGVGDRLTLATPAGRQAFDVAGVVIDYSSDRGTITMDRTTYAALWGDEQVDAFGVFVTPGVDLEQVAERIQRHFAGRYPLYVLTRGKFKERVLELVEQPFAVTYALEVIAILVALLGVTNALYASIIERTRELGVLRAVGATRQFGWTLQMTIPVLFAGATMLLLVLATIAASIQPARRAARVHLTEAVQYE